MKTIVEPRIQYAKTSDGVSIAYWTLGSGGTPLVLLPWIPFNHVQLNWENPENRRLYERLSARRQIIGYDGRGSGLSDREANFALDSHVLDLEAVLDKLGILQVDLWAFLTSGPVAISYAAAHPERVSHLVFWCSFSRGSDLLASRQSQGLVGLIDMDWELFTETAASVIFGWSAGEPARQFARYMRESGTPEMVRPSLTVLAELDVSELLPKIRCPSLVLHRRHIEYLGLNAAKLLASRIPDARLVAFDGDSTQMYSDTDAILTAVEGFLGGGEDLPSGMTAILFADIADSTALTERVGDAAFRANARDLDAGLRAVIREHAGTPIEGKLLGDGVLAVFTSARQAIAAAEACAGAGASAGMPLHLGLHAGDVIREDNNVYGGAVNIASRIAGLSAAGELLVSETVRSLARTSGGVLFEDRGRRKLKGVGEPVRVWAVVRKA